ncbi:MAG: HEAT repeat domain-containing protein [Nevskia sp.]|nr:HEAT repeat domain-containing protein [Nevskia sp.]
MHASHPELSHFVARVEQSFDREDPQSFWTLQDDFIALLRSGFPAAALNNELAQLAQNPAYQGDWQTNQLVLHRARGWALALWLYERPRRYLHSTPYYGMLAPLGDDCLHYEVYELPADHRNEVFDPAQRLSPAGAGLVGPGGVLLLHSDRQVYDFRSARPCVTLKFTTAAVQPMEWLFARDTLYAVQANDSTLDSTQLRVAAYTLGRLAHPSSREPLEYLSRHAHHAVRWAAVRNLAQIDREAALAGLERMSVDPHPHLRRAAAETLRRARREV